MFHKYGICKIWNFYIKHGIFIKRSLQTRCRIIQGPPGNNTKLVTPSPTEPYKHLTFKNTTTGIIMFMKHQWLQNIKQEHFNNNI